MISDKCTFLFELTETMNEKLLVTFIRLLENSIKNWCFFFHCGNWLPSSVALYLLMISNDLENHLQTQISAKKKIQRFISFFVYGYLFNCMDLYNLYGAGVNSVD